MLYNDLISREAFKKDLNSRLFPQDYSTTLLLGMFNELIDNAPTAFFPLIVRVNDKVTDEHIEILKQLMKDYKPQVLNLEIEKTPDWIPIKMRPGTDEEYEKFCKYGDCPREDFRVFDCLTPDDNQEVLITTLWGDVCIDTWHNEIDCSWFEDHEDIDDVIAWMPLPERYQSEVQHDSI